MGVDLSFVPVDTEGPYPHGQTVLKCDNGSYWQERIEAKVQLYDLPKNFACHLADTEEGTGYGVVKEDKYGNTIHCATAGELAAIMVDGDPGMTQRNRAVRAYLQAMPPRTWVAIIYF